MHNDKAKYNSIFGRSYTPVIADNKKHYEHKHNKSFDVTNVLTRDNKCVNNTNNNISTYSIGRSNFASFLAKTKYDYKSQISTLPGGSKRKHNQINDDYKRSHSPNITAAYCRMYDNFHTINQPTHINKASPIPKRQSAFKQHNETFHIIHHEQRPRCILRYYRNLSQFLIT